MQQKVEGWQNTIEIDMKKGVMSLFLFFFGERYESYLSNGIFHVVIGLLYQELLVFEVKSIFVTLSVTKSCITKALGKMQ